MTRHGLSTHWFSAGQADLRCSISQLLLRVLNLKQGCISMMVKLKIFRFDPKSDKEPHYDSFTVDAKPTDRLLDCLNKVRWEQDGSLAYRMSCAHGICGSDGMTINGVSALACQKLVKDYDADKEILIEPLSVFQVVKDLVVDLEPFFEREKSVHPPSGISLTERKRAKSTCKPLSSVSSLMMT